MNLESIADRVCNYFDTKPILWRLTLGHWPVLLADPEYRKHRKARK